jgi:ribosome-associated heat shock protein Hsp15
MTTRAVQCAYSEAWHSIMDPVRIDKWLWAARFFKTRGLAQQAIEQGRVRVGGARVKVARALREGDCVEVEIGDIKRELIVLELSEQRGPAVQAQRLYRETEASVATRLAQAERRRLAPEPSLDLHGRPTKRDRRDLDRWREGG